MLSLGKSVGAVPSVGGPAFGVFGDRHESGCPILAFFARVGGDAPTPILLLPDKPVTQSFVVPALRKTTRRTGHPWSCLRQRVQRPDHPADRAYWIGSIYALLGDNAQALPWLRRAIALGNHNYPWFVRDKNWDKLRGDREYQRLLAEIRTYADKYRQKFGASSF
jgi:hypothetical protein